MRRRGTALGLLFVTAACSASTTTTTSSSLDPSQRLVTLSTSQQQSLCDWAAQQPGGAYGTTTVCEASGGPLYAAKDQADCVSALSEQASRFPGCPTTVDQYETCIEWFLANWCTASMPLQLPQDCATFQNECFPSANNPGLPYDAGGGGDAEVYPPCPSGPLPDGAMCSVDGSGPRD